MAKSSSVNNPIDTTKIDSTYPNTNIPLGANPNLSNNSILKNSSTSHDLFIKKTKLHRQYTDISIKNKSNSQSSSKLLHDSECLFYNNNNKSLRPGSAMTTSQLNHN